jgi:hypothetical protein
MKPVDDAGMVRVGDVDGALSALHPTMRIAARVSAKKYTRHPVNDCGCRLPIEAGWRFTAAVL